MGIAKIPLTVSQMRDYATLSMKNGTQNVFIDIALDWMEQATREIERLKKELEDDNN